MWRTSNSIVDIKKGDQWNDFEQLFPQMFIYDGKTSEYISELGGEKAHNGGIYAVSPCRFSSVTINAVNMSCTHVIKKKNLWSLPFYQALSRVSIQEE